MINQIISGHMLRVLIAIACVYIFLPVSGQDKLVFGKYKHKTEVGHARLKYSYYTERYLELKVDSQYVLQKFVYHTSKPGLQSGFELVESSKNRGYWKYENDLLYLRRISMEIELKESSFIEPNWVKLDLSNWTKNKGYFLLRKKPKR